MTTHRASYCCHAHTSRGLPSTFSTILFFLGSFRRFAVTFAHFALWLVAYALVLALRCVSAGTLVPIPRLSPTHFPRLHFAGQQNHGRFMAYKIGIRDVWFGSIKTNWFINMRTHLTTQRSLYISHLSHLYTLTYMVSLSLSSYTFLYILLFSSLLYKFIQIDTINTEMRNYYDD